MTKIPYQINDSGIVALLPDGRVEFLSHEIKEVLDQMNQGLISSFDFDPYIINDPLVDLHEFHLSAPAIAFIETTNLCNLRCKHCYADSAFKRPNEMSTEMILQLIDTFDEMGVLQVFLTGGEIFSHPDAIKIINYAMEKKFLTQIFTNGLLITEEKLAAIKPGASFFISFDTADPERTIRGGMDFPKLRRVFEWMKKYGHVFRTAISVHRYNLDDVEEIFQWCVDNDYPRPQWLETHPVGRALLHPDILLKPEDIDRVFEIYKRCMDRFSQGPDDIDIGLGQDAEEIEMYSVQTISFCQRLEQATNQEKCGRSIVYVNSAGDVYPCSNCMANGMYKAGNLREKSFKEIWEDGFSQFRSITYDDFQVCQTCNVYKEGIWCQFRCPPLAKNVSNDERGCGATEYIRAFMLKTDAYWRERQEENIRLTLSGNKNRKVD
ncbi:MULTISPECIES: radical SAM/SPASM domain-containing protein [Geobacillus]|uniref:radical SAM/SPASM domain-containing protein n=1 Tax=Geobacillus TaxID=129337 RepID=UPI0005CCA808|nr:MULTISPECIES: radical SAM protein [Geobacillus]TWG25023.1 radical SAM protein with 4Fe4S-binding SPASM domain [Geobacillus sp. C56-T2]